jgi:magnesium transporter
MRYDAARCTEQENCVLDQLPALAAAGEVLWLDVVGLGSSAFMASLGERFGLHGLALEDVLNTHQRPKVEAYADHLYLVARVPVSGQPETQQVSIFLTRGLVITLQGADSDCFAQIRERLRQGKGRIRGMPADYLVYALVDVVVDHYFPILEEAGETLEQLENDIVENPTPEQIERLHALKHTLLSLRRAIWPTRDMLSALVRDDLGFVQDSTHVYLRDVQDHTFQLIDILETYREIASSLMDVYLSSLSTKLNAVMKTLTIMATVFMPMTFITGLYGMNFDRSSPWNLPELGWRFGYPFALGIMTALAVGFLYYFSRKGWLRK